MMESLGQKLKDAREAKGLSLEEVAKVTKISERSLLLIEKGQFEELPAPTYIKGFLKLFSQSVGLDPAMIVEEFQKSQTSETKQVLILEGEKINSPDYWKIAASVSKNLWEFIEHLLKRVHPKVWIGVGALILLLWVIPHLFKSKPHQEGKNIIPSAVIESPKISSGSSLIKPQSPSENKNILNSRPPASSSVETPASPLTTQGELLTLVGEVKQTVWVRIHSDDRLVFEGTLKKGTRETWKANQYFKLRIGNSDAIKFTLNDKELGRLGPVGKIKNVRLTQDGWYVSD